MAVVGPTGVGKSEVALAVARRFRAEIVNLDSRQLYRGLDVGTAKPGEAERREIPHHGFDLLDPRESMSAGAWAAFARTTIDGIRARGRLPLLVGGTGFYLRALRDGLAPLPTTFAPLRARLKLLLGDGPPAHRWLAAIDPPRAREIAGRDRDRSIRAIEVALLSGRRMSTLLGEPRSGALAARWLLVGCRRRRDRLYSRISERVETMFESGLIDEVRRSLDAGIPADAPGLSAIGYRETVDLLAGRIEAGEARSRATLATRRYAKRQETWFRSEPGIEWFDLDEERVGERILERIAAFLEAGEGRS